MVFSLNNPSTPRDQTLMLIDPQVTFEIAGMLAVCLTTHVSDSWWISVVAMDRDKESELWYSSIYILLNMLLIGTILVWLVNHMLESWDLTVCETVESERLLELLSYPKSANKFCSRGLLLSLTCNWASYRNAVVARQYLCELDTCVSLHELKASFTPRSRSLWVATVIPMPLWLLYSCQLQVY